VRVPVVPGGRHERSGNGPTCREPEPVRRLAGGRCVPAHRRVRRGLRCADRAGDHRVGHRCAEPARTEPDPYAAAPCVARHGGLRHAGLRHARLQHARLQHAGLRHARLRHAVRRTSESSGGSRPAAPGRACRPVRPVPRAGDRHAAGFHGARRTPAPDRVDPGRCHPSASHRIRTRDPLPGRAGKARRATPKGGPPRKNVRRRPTLPRSGPRSTIGAEGLSFRVRNGTGRFPFAMTAETLSSCGRIPDRRSGTAQWTRSIFVVKPSAY